MVKKPRISMVPKARSNKVTRRGWERGSRHKRGWGWGVERKKGTDHHWWNWYMAEKNAWKMEEKGNLEKDGDIKYHDHNERQEKGVS